MATRRTGDGEQICLQSDDRRGAAGGEDWSGVASRRILAGGRDNRSEHPRDGDKWGREIHRVCESACLPLRRMGTGTG